MPSISYMHDDRIGLFLVVFLAFENSANKRSFLPAHASGSNHMAASQGRSGQITLGREDLPFTFLAYHKLYRMNAEVITTGLPYLSGSILDGSGLKHIESI